MHLYPIAVGFVLDAMQACSEAREYACLCREYALVSRETTPSQSLYHVLSSIEGRLCSVIYVLDS